MSFAAMMNGATKSPYEFYVYGTKSGNYLTAYTDVTNTFFKLIGTAANDVTYKPTVLTTEFDPITLEKNVWYRFLVKATNIVDGKADIVVRITNYTGTEVVFEKSIEGANISACGVPNGLCWDSPRDGSVLALDDVALKTDRTRLYSISYSKS